MDSMEKIIQEGGMTDGGMEKDPISGNDIPPGSTAKEVRDDVDVKLSEGEYVVPADVLQYYGVKFFEDLRQRAKSDLEGMEKDGRIGGEPVAKGGDLTDEEMKMLQEALMADPEAAPRAMQEGGVVDRTEFGPSYGSSEFQQMFTPYGSNQPVYGPNTSGQGNMEQQQYINSETGEVRQFAFINGQPVAAIPEGFVPYSQEALERIQSSLQESPSGGSSSRGSGPMPSRTREQTSYTEKMRDMENLSDDELQKAVEGFESKNYGRIAGGVGSLLLGPVAGAAAGAGGVAYEATKGYNTAVELERRAILAEAQGNTERSNELRGLGETALSESRWGSPIADILGTKKDYDMVRTEANKLVENNQRRQRDGDSALQLPSEIEDIIREQAGQSPDSGSPSGSSSGSSSSSGGSSGRRRESTSSSSSRSSSPKLSYGDSSAQSSRSSGSPKLSYGSSSSGSSSSGSSSSGSIGSGRPDDGSRGSSSSFSQGSSGGSVDSYSTDSSDYQLSKGGIVSKPPKKNKKPAKKKGLAAKR